jgi:apolipoprotein N-acyltransferase
VNSLRARPLLPSLLLTLLSAALYAASFAPLALAPLAWVALAPWFAACARVRPLAGAGLGVLWGVAACWGVSYWLPGMLQDFFAVDAALAWAAFFAIALVLAGLYYGGFGAWLAFAARRGSLPPLLVGCAFAACEWARASLLIPTPWALSAYSQPSGSALVQIADLGGPFGIGLLIGAVNAALAGLFAPALRTSRPGLARASVAAALLAALGYGELRLAQDFADGEPAGVALVQGAVERGRRFQREHRDANLARHLELSGRAAAAGAEVILWPEFAADFYLDEPSPQRERIDRFARESHASLLVGAPDYRYTATRTQYFNSAFVVEGGVLRGRYDKVHLMPFSESNPLRGIAAIGSDLYTAGSSVRPLPTRAGRVGVLLCSEAMLPGYAGELARAGAEWLANPSNDDWFRDLGAARQQLAAVALRAVENRRFVLRPAAAGYTAVIDAHGRVVAEAPYGEPAFLAAHVRGSRATTPYQAWGDAVALGAGGLGLAWTFIPFALAGRRRQETRTCSPTPRLV